MQDNDKEWWPIYIFLIVGVFGLLVFNFVKYGSPDTKPKWTKECIYTKWDSEGWPVFEYVCPGKHG